MNVNDPRVPLNGFIHYSHLNPAAWPGGGLVYVPLYMPTDDPRYTRPEGELSAELVAGLRVMVPDLAEEEIELARLSRDEYAQAITPRGFARRVPAIQGPVPGLCVLDSTQLYPSDRCLSGMIGLARQMAAGVGSGE